MKETQRNNHVYNENAKILFQFETLFIYLSEYNVLKLLIIKVSNFVFGWFNMVGWVDVLGWFDVVEWFDVYGMFNVLG